MPQAPVPTLCKGKTAAASSDIGLLSMPTANSIDIKTSSLFMSTFVKETALRAYKDIKGGVI